MFAKILNNAVEKYPYSLDQLRKDNPQVSFPSLPSEDLLKEFGVVSVTSVSAPDCDENAQKVTPDGCVFNELNARWETSWKVVDLTPEEIEKLKTAHRLRMEQTRLQAYRDEADPLFFKAQRGEATMEEWTTKVAEIKARFPE